MSLQTNETPSTSLVLSRVDSLDARVLHGRHYHFSYDYSSVLAQVKRAIKIEIGRRYPETGSSYAEYVISESSCALTASNKSILVAITRGELAGFTVATPKDNFSVKFGPTIVFPRFRNRRLAYYLRRISESHYSKLGFLRAYSTCRFDNPPAIRYVQNANYKLVATLPHQYEIGVKELVFFKSLQRVNHTLPRINSANFQPGLVRKRGGATKIILPNNSNRPLDFLSKNIELIKHTNESHRIFIISKFDQERHNSLTGFGFKLNNHEDIGAVLYGLDL